MWGSHQTAGSLNAHREQHYLLLWHSKLRIGFGLEVAYPMFTETTVQKTAESQTGWLCQNASSGCPNVLPQPAFLEAASQRQGIANGFSFLYQSRWDPSSATHFPSAFIQPNLSGISLAAYSWVVANKKLQGWTRFGSYRMVLPLSSFQWNESTKKKTSLDVLLSSLTIS